MGNPIIMGWAHEEGPKKEWSERGVENGRAHFPGYEEGGRKSQSFSQLISIQTLQGGQRNEKRQWISSNDPVFITSKEDIP